MITCFLSIQGCEAKNPFDKGNSASMSKSIIIDSPVHAICITPNTPGSKIPSHGTSKYGEMYAIDFVVINRNAKSRKAYRKGIFEYLFKGIALVDFYGWGENIYSPVNGKIVKVVNDIDERNPVNIANDIRNMMTVTRRYEDGQGSPESITGNCVIIEHGNGIYALLAHLQKGSIIVREGQIIKSQQVIGKLGHSGNSTMPHLHMQIMDSMDFKKAKGIPFIINRYDVLKSGEWIKAENTLPRSNEILKFE
jgi:hypothetical protein